MRMTSKALIMAILFAVSAFTFASKLLMPTPIQIVIPGEEPIVVGQIFRYTHFDVAIISVSAVILAISSVYLLFINSGETQFVSSINEGRNNSELNVSFVLRLLDDLLKGRIVREAVAVLNKLGVEIHNQNVVDLLADHGARVDKEKDRVFLKISL